MLDDTSDYDPQVGMSPINELWRQWQVLEQVREWKERWVADNLPSDDQYLVLLSSEGGG